MAEQSSGSDGTAAQSAGAAPAPLDDVMIAMDVVDTLRHDDQIVARELDGDARKADLIERLRKIYEGQGIAVPDRILEEGVKALEEQRFSYTPPKPSWERWLAEIYVSRHDWGRLAAGIAFGVGLAWVAWYLWIERPRTQRIAAAKTELTETLPKTIRNDLTRIEATGAGTPVMDRVRKRAAEGLAAAAAGDRKAARAAATDLAALREKLSAAYTIRIVNRRGAVTGFSRVPKVNPNTRNYYLVVEAIDSQGKVIPQRIRNEETGKDERVTAWAVRVPASVYDRMRADKADDGILQLSTVATKARGKLEPDWKIETTGGALTRWAR